MRINFKSENEQNEYCFFFLIQILWGATKNNNLTTIKMLMYVSVYMIILLLKMGSSTATIF